MAEMLRGILMYDRGDRVHVAALGDSPKTRGSVDRDTGGAVVQVHIDGVTEGIRKYPHDASPIPRGALTLIRVDEDGYDIEDDEKE